MTSRRSFIGSVLAMATAPAIVRAGSLMPIYVPKQGIVRAWGGISLTLRPGQQFVIALDGSYWRVEDRVITPAGSLRRPEIFYV